MLTSSTLVAVLLLTLSTLKIASSDHATILPPSNRWQEPSLCWSNTSYPTSQLYGLRMMVYRQSLIFNYNMRKSDVILTVYAKNCPNLETMGPSWYRLEPIPPTNGLGSYKYLLSKSGAIIQDHGIEFNGADEPLTILDLPRTYTWITKEEQITEACFKLTIQHGDSCEQIVTPNCQDINMTTQNRPSTTTESITSTTTQSRTSTSSTPSPATATSATPNEVAEKCHKFNCTGRRESRTCGSDGLYYTNVCELRLHKCLNDLPTLQRDKTEMSCNRNMTTPTVTPTIPLGQTCRRRKYIHPQIFSDTKCDWRGLHKPIYCYRRQEDDEVVCVCINPIDGSAKGNEWEMNCTDYNTTIHEQRCKI